MKEILPFFPELTAFQVAQLEKLPTIYNDWNSKINVVSRKDIDELPVRHVLHSLALAKVQPFLPEARILDVGTGGGFPGIPLAILFPETTFHLIDVIGKKIKVVQAVADELELKNVKAEQLRAEKANGNYDFVVSRAVTNMTDFTQWIKGKIAKKQRHELENGVLYLKGGDLSQELQDFPMAKEYAISEFYSNPFFDTKKVVHLPMNTK